MKLIITCVLWVQLLRIGHAAVTLKEPASFWIFAVGSFLMLVYFYPIFKSKPPSEE